MPNIDKLVATWAGFSGSPGYTSFYFSAAQGPSMQPKVVAFFQAIAPYITPNVTVTVPASGVTIDASTGQEVNAWSGGSSTLVTGTHTNLTFAPELGAMVRMETGQFRRGRRVRGRLFLVPISMGNFTAQGVLTTTAANAINAAATALNSLQGQWIVWHRPLKDYSVKPPTLKETGEALPITSTTCPLKSTYLSSRRD